MLKLRLPLAIILCTTGLWACDEDNTGPVSTGSTSFSLEANSDGDLVCSDEAAATEAGVVCGEYPNPDNCARLDVTIDNALGTTCEQCFDDAGNLLRDSCDDTSIGCVTVTLPEPDCVVCAYSDGAIIFSSCVVDDNPDDVICAYYTNGSSSGSAGSGGGSPGAPTDPAQPPCANDECGPAPGAPNTFCEDGTIGGPVCDRDANGVCGWSFRECDPTVVCDCGPRPEIAGYPCPDGTQAGAVCVQYDAGDCGWEIRECRDECRICRNAQTGEVVLDECRDDCDDMMCPAVLCAEGSMPRRLPGQCCETCVPIDDCSLVDCPALDATAIACPDGTRPVQTPNDCCGFYCEPNGCIDYIVDPCPTGSFWDCDRCVPLNPDLCLDNTDCGPDFYCAWDEGFCGGGSAGDPTDPNGAPAQCWGICRPSNPTCGDIAVGGTTDPNEPNPALPYCEGEWVVTLDADGCERPVCVCPDGIATQDGRCFDQCATVSCAQPEPCQPGYHHEFGFPNCCGLCVPDEPCLDPATGTTDPTCVCPEILCAPGFEPGQVAGDLCGTCLPVEWCYNSQECGLGEVCTVELGECNSDPSCPACDVCTGSCRPTGSACNDSDGMDPNVGGAVTFGADGAGTATETLSDRCLSDNTVIEYYCLDAASPAEVAVACPNGCTTDTATGGARCN